MNKDSINAKVIQGLEAVNGLSLHAKVFCSVLIVLIVAYFVTPDPKPEYKFNQQTIMDMQMTDKVVTAEDLVEEALEQAEEKEEARAESLQDRLEAQRKLTNNYINQ